MRGGSHGFDLDEDSGMSREIVQQVLMFLRFHLEVEPATGSAPGTPALFGSQNG